MANQESTMTASPEKTSATPSSPQSKGSDLGPPEQDLILPDDEYNRRLVANVHPLDWENPEPQERYHLVVIGAGTAGLVTSIVAAGLGAKVALVERHLMGGDCLNVGCVPSKGIISAARAWNQRSREKFGAPPASGDGDFAQAMERMRRLRAEISHVDGAQRFTDAGVDVFLGEGRFLDDETVEVGGQRLRFRRAVICTGARASAPPIPGLESVGYRTNESIFSLTERPGRLAVIGAGPIGCEMAQSFAQLGSEVTLLDLAPQVLSREDADAAAVVQEAMTRDGVRLELGIEVERVEQRGSEKIVHWVRHSDDGEERGSAVADELLVAVGRKPNVDSLGLDEVGVESDGSGVAVDDRLRTSNKRIFAAGDVTQSLDFTHLADAHAAIVIQNALFFGRARRSKLVVPWCTYTSPEIAHVGLYEHEAEKRGVEVDVLTVPMDDVDRALLDGEDEGFLKVVLKKGSDEILGATLVASHAGDLIAPLTMAITHGIGLGKFASTIFPYPTQAEVLKKAANAWRKRKLSPTVQKIFAWWFRLLG
jgi:pyruvate/2-oxoglutarate dehydrogenase complex dihydrolipoamide dehydrogenase (E3) component